MRRPAPIPGGFLFGAVPFLRPAPGCPRPVVPFLLSRCGCLSSRCGCLSSRCGFFVPRCLFFRPGAGVFRPCAPGGCSVLSLCVFGGRALRSPRKVLRGFFWHPLAGRVLSLCARSALPARGVRSGCCQSALPARGVRSGCAPAALRLRSGCPPAALRLRSGCPPAALRLSSGCAPAVLRLRSGCAPAVLRLRSGCAPAVLRLRSGCPPAVFPLSSGCPPAVLPLFVPAALRLCSGCPPAALLARLLFFPWQDFFFLNFFFAMEKLVSLHHGKNKLEKNHRVHYQGIANNTWCVARLKYHLKIKKL